MTDAISHKARIAQSSAAVRSNLDKLDKASAKNAALDESKVSTTKSAQGDTVNLSNVEQKIKDQPDFDRAKVEAIKQAIKDGNYPLNPKRIAESFVSLEKMIQG